MTGERLAAEAGSSREGWGWGWRDLAGRRGRRKMTGRKAVRSEPGKPAPVEGGGVEAFGWGDDVDDEKRRREGGGGEERRFGEGRHGLND